VHPGETVSSFIIEGLIKFLVIANKNSNDPSSIFLDHNRKPYSSNAIRTAKYLRRKFIFMIVPMVNPDGVIAGNYRSSFAGHDLNKVFL
jgi:murein tripeptide amidase MpaA